MASLRLLLVLISLFLIVNSIPAEDTPGDAPQFPGECLKCDKLVLTCQGCGANESCVLSTRSCFECPRPQCVKNKEANSIPIWLIATIVSISVGLILLLIFIWWFFHYKLRTDKSKTTTPGNASNIETDDVSAVEVFNRYNQLPKHQPAVDNGLLHRTSMSSLNFGNFWKRTVPEEDSVFNYKPRPFKTQIFTQSEIDLILPPPKKAVPIEEESEQEQENYLDLSPCSLSSSTSIYSQNTQGTDSKVTKNSELSQLSSNEIAMLKLGRSLARAKTLSCIARPKPACKKDINFVTSTNSPLPSPITINPPLQSPSQNIQFGYTLALPKPFNSNFEGYSPKSRHPVSQDPDLIYSAPLECRTMNSITSDFPEPPSEPGTALVSNRPTFSGRPNQSMEVDFCLETFSP